MLALLAAAPARADRPGLNAYRGTGAWIDVYDHAARRRPEMAVADMAEHGISTLYLETGNWRLRRSADMPDPDAVGRFIAAAHAAGIQVVAWYLPGLVDRRLDMRRIRAAIDFTTPDGQRFDSFALDIEANLVNPVWRRNLSLLRLSRSLRRIAGDDYALGAIVPDQLSTSSGNVLWPYFPYPALDRVYDVFLPMSYSTFKRAKGARAVYSYTRSGIDFIRSMTGNPDARVHVIGGLTDRLRATESTAVVRAARDAGAIGVSLYKYTRYDDGEWSALTTFPSSPAGGLPVPAGP